jgi:hypothetical protein
VLFLPVLAMLTGPSVIRSGPQPPRTWREVLGDTLRNLWGLACFLALMTLVGWLLQWLGEAGQ